MDERVTIGLEVDSSQASAELSAIQQRADKVTREWAVNRNTILRQIRESYTMISSLVGSFRQAMSLFNAQIDPFYDALLNVVMSTVSMLISAASTLASTGIGGAAAAVVMAIAISFNILTTAKLIEDRFGVSQSLKQITAELGRVGFRTGGSF